MSAENTPHRGEQWHIGKEIPIALVFGIAMQTCIAIWWAAGVSSDLKSLRAEVSEMRNERYTQSDAVKDMEVAKQRLSDIERRVDRLEGE
jgi:Tfp pilus assembly protein PilO